MAADRQLKIKTLETLLVLEARAGHQSAIEKLVELRGSRLLSHAARLSGDRDAAYDITQEAWVQIIQGLPKLRDENAFLPWALCIVSRRVAAFIKTRQKDRKLSEDYGSEVSQSITSETNGSLDAETIRAALTQLPPVQHATIALFYLEDMTVAEVARALDVPVGTVKTRLMAARSNLRTLFEGDYNG